LSQNKTFDLLDTLIVIAKHKLFIVGVVLTSTILALIIALTWPKTYQSTSEVIQTRESVGSLGSLLENFGSLSSGQNKIGGETILVILNSESLRLSIIEEFELNKVYGTEIKERLLKILSGSIYIEASREGGFGFNPIVSVKIAVEDEKPQRAQAINSFVIDQLKEKMEGLNKETSMESLTILEKRLAQNLTDLENSEKKLKEFQNTYGLIQLDSQLELIVENLADIKAEIIQREVEMNYLRENLTSNSNQLKKLEAEKKALEMQYQKLISKSEDFEIKNDGFYPLQEFPDLMYSYYILRRDVEIQNKIYQILIPQLEQQRLYLQNQGSGIKLIDEPELPTYKHSPKRAYIVIGGFASSLLIALVLVFIREARIDEDSEIAKKLEEFKHQITRLK
tara:strand:+ start:13357 stop:14541 length:1185 start_codon:yes stop_codon:yes gene_type:complete